TRRIGPGGKDGFARRRDLAIDHQLARLGFQHDVHLFLTNSMSMTISIGSANMTGIAKSCGLIQPVAWMPMRGWPPKPLPAPIRVTSNVTGAVLPSRVSWPSIVPSVAPAWRNAVEAKVISGKRGAFRNAEPASSLAKPLTLEVIDSVLTDAVTL